MLRDKIKGSDDPNACLLTICDIFESDDVDNAILKKHGANMRASISSKTHSITILSKHFVSIDGAAATPAQVPTGTPTVTTSYALPQSSAVHPVSHPEEYSKQKFDITYELSTI